MAAERRSSLRFRLIMTPVTIVSCLVASLSSQGPAHEGQRDLPYRDSNGVWTVCAGLTGENVIPGRRYTSRECQRMEHQYIEQMLHNLARCVTAELSVDEMIAWGHFAYNIGSKAFCQSSAARRLNEGERLSACAEISKWVFVGHRDCRNPQNQCLGLVKRRAWERELCEHHASSSRREWSHPTQKTSETQ